MVKDKYGKINLSSISEGRRKDKFKKVVCDVSRNEYLRHGDQSDEVNRAIKVSSIGNIRLTMTNLCTKVFSDGMPDDTDRRGIK